MIYISMFSGIEAASVAWHQLGFKASAFSEFDKFPSAVLSHRWPEIPNLGDMTKVDWKKYQGEVDLVVGGPPCQAFSVAGLRGSLNDARGNLSLAYVRAILDIRPRWCLTENVPGWLNTTDNAFGCYLAGLLGADAPLVSSLEGGGWPCSGIASGPEYSAAWTVLDAQYFGVPQRRRRVFVVGYLGDWRRAASVLFESHSMSGNSPPSRKAGKGSAEGSGRGTTGGELGGEGLGDKTLTAKAGYRANACDETLIAHTLRGEGFDASEDGTGRGTPLVFDMRGRGDGEISPTLCTDHASRPSDMCPVIFSQGNLARGEGPRPSLDVVPTLQSQAGDQHPCVAFTQNCRSEVREIGGDGQIVGALTAEPGVQQQNYIAYNETATSFMWQSALGMSETEEGAGTLIKNQTPAGQRGSAVRRLTPVECERLQGFPDNYTQAPYRGKPASDGPRYKAIGNSMAVPVMRWIGERIQLVDGIKEISEMK